MSDTQILYSPRQVSKLLAVPLSTVYAYIANQQLPAVRIGTKLRVHRNTLEQIAQEGLGKLNHG
jgi:excisionase family DNA binding protein